MASKPKNSRTKPPSGRPASTAQLSHPVVEGSSTLTSLSSFSSEGNLFAFISLAIDKHRLRVYDTISGRSVAEQIVDASGVTTLAWRKVDLAEGKSSVEDISPSPLKKKRKNRKSLVGETPTDLVEVVLLGLSTGELLIFSPSHGRTLRTLSHPSSRSAILSVEATDRPTTIWTSSADGAIRRWDAQKNGVLGIWKTDDRIPYSSMTVRPGFAQEDQDGRVDIVCANHSIHLLSMPATSEIDISEVRKPKELASFTGHASSVTNLHWDSSQKPANRFLSTAEGDRFVSIWEIPSTKAGSSKDGKIVASIPLDSDARSISLSVSQTPSGSTAGRQCLLALSASGKISVYPIPSELTQPASSHKTPDKIPTLLSRSNISLSFKKNVAPVQVVAASFAVGDPGRIHVARIVGGARPVFDVVHYLDQAGDFIQDVSIVSDDNAVGKADHAQMAAPNMRYTERSTLAIRTGVELGQESDMDDLPSRNVDGDLDVDLAELSLGQRLAALEGPDGPTGRMSSSDNESESSSKRFKESGKKRKNKVPEVPTNSLTRTLIQALHSSDSGLLETCLRHSDQNLIYNTVRRLPPQLAVPLVIACVDRLGRGARGNNMKGRGGGSSSQKGTTLVRWVKAVLTVHSGHLMTMPDLVAKLSGLHATLTTRLTLQESLLSLSGRLDMVLSQIEMRSSVALAPMAPQKGMIRSSNPDKKVNRYVEGESENDSDEMAVEVERGSGDDEGSIEDVELGGDSQGEESSEDEKSEGEDGSEGDSDEEDDSDGEGPTMNGFIDDEAEEYSGEEDEDDSE